MLGLHGFLFPIFPSSLLLLHYLQVWVCASSRRSWGDLLNCPGSNLSCGSAKGLQAWELYLLMYVLLYTRVPTLAPVCEPQSDLCHRRTGDHMCFTTVRPMWSYKWYFGQTSSDSALKFTHWLDSFSLFFRTVSCRSWESWTTATLSVCGTSSTPVETRSVTSECCFFEFMCFFGFRATLLLNRWSILCSKGFG